jgi:hypothetical protein
VAFFATAFFAAAFFAAAFFAAVFFALRPSRPCRSGEQALGAVRGAAVALAGGNEVPDLWTRRGGLLPSPRRFRLLRT